MRIALVSPWTYPGGVTRHIEALAGGFRALGHEPAVLAPFDPPDHLADKTGFLGAVAVLFAVNVTMLLPVTPGDVGVFQAATAAVLQAGWQVPFSTGVAFGVVLQAVELVAALLMGVPALLMEGLSWRQLIQRSGATTPIVLPRNETAATARL
jgi:uncharacterized membrane protein YbhN (UPF0104 family)